MKVDTMRKVDRRAGVPLCFLLTPIVWLTDLLRGARTKKPDIQRTLFIELSEMGSAIIADPAMRKLQQNGGELYFVIFNKNVKSLDILQTVSPANVFSMKADSLWTIIPDIFRFMAWCRRKKITTVIDLELFSRFTALLAFFSGARTRIGYASFHDEGLYRGNLINFPVRYNSHVHVGYNFISLVNRAMGLYDNPYSTVAIKPEELTLTRAAVQPASVKKVEDKIRQLYPQWQSEAIVLWNVNASDLLPQRRWPQQNFATVARSLLQEFDDILVVATGAPAEYDYVQAVVGAVDHPRCVNSAGMFAFDELVPLYSISEMMLTNDSGPAHFASVTSLKVFVIFGPETPELYLPLGNAEPFYLALPCSPCVSAFNHRKTTCVTRPCITGIQPGWILGRIKQYLATERKEAVLTK